MSQTESIVRPPFQWGESLEEACEQAEREDRVVLLDFYSPT